MENHDAFLQETIVEWKITTLSCGKRSWNGKSRRFPAGNDRGMENHDAFLQETIVEWRITTLSCRKRSWIGKSRRFPAGKDRGRKIYRIPGGCSTFGSKRGFATGLATRLRANSPTF